MYILHGTYMYMYIKLKLRMAAKLPQNKTHWTFEGVLHAYVNYVLSIPFWNIQYESSDKQLFLYKKLRIKCGLG